MKKIIPPLLLFLSPFLLFFSLLDGGELRGYFDLIRYAYPDRFFGMGSLAGGVIPLWNPYLLCGVPYLANWQSGLLYPLNFIFMLFPFDAAFNIFGIFHLGAAGLGSWLLARRLGLGSGAAFIAGLIFSLGAYPQAIMNYPSHIAAYACLPFILLLGKLAVERTAYLLPLAFVTAMALFAGYPHTLFYTMALLFLFMLAEGGWRVLWKPALVSIFVLLLGAAQLVPFLEFVSKAERLGDWSFDYSLPWRYLYTIVRPFALGQPGGPDYTGAQAFSLFELYAGLLALPLVLLAIFRPVPGRRFFPVLVPFCALYLFGSGTPIGRAFLLLPGGESLEFAKAIPVYMICVALAAAAGAEWAVSRPARKFRWIILSSLIAFCLSDFAVLGSRQEMIDNPYRSSGKDGIVSYLQGMGEGRLLSLRPSEEEGVGYRWAKTRQEAMDAVSDSLQANIGMVHGLYSLNGYLSMLPASYRPIGDYFRYAYPYLKGDLFQRANLHFIIIPGELPPERFELAASRGELNIYRLRDKRPRAYLSLDPDGREPLGGNVYSEDGPGRRRITVSADQDSFLFGGEDISGWYAEMNGEPVSLRRVEPCFYSLEVPAGRHEVRISYRPGSFLIGLFISLSAFMALAFVMSIVLASRFLEIVVPVRRV